LTTGAAGAPQPGPISIVSPTPEAPSPAPPSPPSAEARILLINPPETRNTVAYQVDGSPFEMPSDSQQDLSGGPRQVAFDRGGDFGEARYTLTEGTYVFALGARGWGLYRKTFQVVLDNSANAHPFHIGLGDGTRLVIAAGQSRKLTDRFPILVYFDRGDGGEPASRQLRDGTHRIAVDPSTNLLDLFAVGGGTLDPPGPPDAPRVARN
jgi:hypothetical protein